MEVFFYIVVCFIAGQFLFTWQVFNNLRYALNKYRRPRSSYRPDAVIIIPCKGLDTSFEENIASFFNQDYRPYRVWFVVEKTADPAYPVLRQMIERLKPASTALEVRVFVAGRAVGCSQKLHNILHCLGQVPSWTKALVFADSDACADADWLAHIVYPLHKEAIGAAGGYRWFVPQRKNLATLALSSVNAAVAQLLGNTRFNHAWGGSMAILVDIFKKLNIESVWSRAVCDDLTLSAAVRKAGLKMAYVPACMVASYETTSWPQLFEFVRRQFVITRIYAPRTWFFGLACVFFSVAGLWTTVAAAIYSGTIFFTVAAVVIFLAQFTRAALRQVMAVKLLEKDRRALQPAIIADILLFWLWAIILLVLIFSSAFGRKIRWRNIAYRLKGPLDIEVLAGQ